MPFKLSKLWIPHLVVFLHYYFNYCFLNHSFPKVHLLLTQPLSLSWWVRSVPVHWLLSPSSCSPPPFLFCLQTILPSSVPGTWSVHVAPSLSPSPIMSLHSLFRTFSSVQFSRSVMSNSLQPHGLQHTRLPCPSQMPGGCSNSCPSSQCCHPAVSSSVIPFFSLLQSVPESGSFHMSPFFPSGGQSIELSASASVLPMNIQDWFPLGWTG